ncbi:MAG TPA: DUF2325 domain-containing protein [Ideonella sp.]|uniref:DUF2325 domain-containing protein n=1 Tax=Ideonella sp. TaxID=1929293 RepID=UPI002C0C0097|nr:DUF2325 domain-containing protein [Ideonella sp.]HSI48487.1 DUF2325 domain-containing protein [Ideonella sp.]
MPPFQPAATVTAAALPGANPHPAHLMPPNGSRRRRIWELSGHAQCPVIGVCLPIAVVRKLVDKQLGGKTVASDYELHCGVNAECKLRNAMSETVQKELDRRYAISLRHSQPLKTTEALAGFWAQRSAAGDSVAGALWATLTHPRCDAMLEEQVLQDIHMLQHQNGAADRADLARLQALLDENQVLARELGQAQQRCSRQAEQHARKLDELQAHLMQARAELIGRDTVIADLGQELRRLEAEVPALRERSTLSRQVAEQVERIQDLERALLRSRHEAERERLRAHEALQELHRLQARHDSDCANVGAELPDSPEALAAALLDRAVLCVGGRTGSVPVYRQMIEQGGGRFLHHDGGEEDSTTRLDSTLAAADLVICQTGCISHDAYWRVKDHCKRTGKRCVFVDNPSSAGLRRALFSLKAAGGGQDATSLMAPNPGARILPA